MKRFVYSSVFLFAGLVSNPGFAADYNNPVGAGNTMVEYGSGWYLRGDIAWAHGARHKKGGTIDGIANTETTFDYQDVLGLRAGIGYRVNNNFRVDFTIESLAESSFSNSGPEEFGGSRDVTIQTGVDIDGNPTYTTYTYIFSETAPGVFTVTDTGSTPGYSIGDVVAAQTGTRTLTSDYSMTDYMVNGYYDIGRVGRFEPYVTAGIGIANLAYSENISYECTPLSGLCDVPEDLSVTNDFWTTAWQVGAGVGYAITDQMNLDVSYNYKQIGDGPAINYDDGTAMDPEGLSMHQIRVGLRYDIW